MKVLGINAIFHDPAAALVVDGTGSWPPPRRSGSAGASTASARCRERLGAARAVGRLVPGRGRHLPRRARRRRLLVRPRADGVAGGAPACTTRGRHAEDVRRAGAASSWPTRCPASTRPRSATSSTTSPTPPPPALAAPQRTNSVLVLDGRGEAHSHLAGRYVDGGWRSSPARRCRTRSGCCTRTSPTTWASCAAPTSTRSWRWPPTASRGSSAELSELVRATGDGGFRTEPIDFAEFAAAAAQGRRLDRGARRSGRQRAAAAGGGAARPGPLAARADRRPGAHPGRRDGAQLRGQHPHPRRGPVRRGLGAARRRRRRNRAGRRRCTWPARLGDDTEPMPRRRPRPRVERRARSRPCCARPASTTSARTTSPTPWPRCWPPTGSSPGSRAAASTGRGRWATARCWPTPATRPTWSG